MSVLINEAHKSGHPVAELVNGCGYDEKHLSNRRERVEWGAAHTVFTNARTLWTDRELNQIGERFLSGSVARATGALARLLFGARDFYRWVAEPRKGGGQQIISCIDAAYEDVGEGRCMITMTMQPGFAAAPAFFLLTEGAYRSMPRHLGFGEDAEVTMQLTDQGAVYDIKYPPGGGGLAFLRRIVAWPFSARTVAKELDAANQTLNDRYLLLEQQDSLIRAQRRHLLTAHAISSVIHGDLHMTETCHAVAAALLQKGRFVGVRLQIDAPIQDRPLHYVVTKGNMKDGVRFDHKIVVEGQTVATLTLMSDGDNVPTDLLRLLTPTIDLAVGHAIQFYEVNRFRIDLEDQVQRRTDELTEARDELLSTVQDLEETQRLRDELFANVNHEIRSPVTLSLFALRQIRTMLPEDDAAHEPLTRAVEAHDELLELVDNLLAIAARRERGETRRDIDVSVLLERLVRKWNAAAQAADVDLYEDIAPGIRLFADPVQVRRVFSNLLSNALKFTPPEGTIQMTARRHGGFLEVEIADSGIGVPDAQKERIFERFEQGPKPVRPGARGSGVGLAIVNEVCAEYGGHVKLVDNQSGGSIFTVCIPGARYAIDDVDGLEGIDGPLGARNAPRIGGEPYRGPRELWPEKDPAGTVLVVDDNPRMLREVAESVRQKYRVLLASNGEEALSLAARERPDLLLSDVHMPLMDGVTLAGRFGEMDGNAFAPVILLTADATPSFVQRGFAAGVVDYLRKPVDPDELLARIGAQLALRDLARQLHEREKNASLGLLVSSLAHDLRNPVNGICNAIAPLREVLDAHLVDERDDADALLQVLESGAERLRQLAQQLLGTTKRGQLELTDVDLGAIIDSSARAAAAPPFRVSNRVPRGVEIRGAGPLLTQVFVNLFENAAKSRPDGTVTVHAFEGRHGILVEVTDDGPGISPELWSRLFEPFFTTRGHAGTGLGLYTARRIVEQHGGAIEVMKVRRGAGFRLTFQPTDRPLPPELSRISL